MPGAATTSIPEPGAAGSTRRPRSAWNGFVGVLRISTASPRPDRPLDADRRRLAERDLEAVLVRERRLDHLPLHLAVERDRDLRPRVVLADVDQRVLLGELPERDAQALAVRGVDRLDDRLERRRSEVMVDVAARLAEPVADLDLREAPELRDLARVHRVPLYGVAVREDADRGHLAGVEAVADASRLPRRAACTRSGGPRVALDLEDAGRERSVAVPGLRRQELRDPAPSPHRRRRR